MGNERREIPNEDDNPFVSLGDLLSKKVSVATLATAIEKHGIYTWDRFGRFGKIEKENAATAAATAFDYLARVVEWEDEHAGDAPGIHPAEQHPLDATNGMSTPFCTFGWAKEVLPDLDTIKHAQTEAPQKPGVAVKRKAPDKFVAALVRLLVEIAKRDPKIDIDAMPGTKADFLALAQKQDAELDRPLATFDTYIESLCKFRPGSRTGDYYQKLFPNFFK